MVRNNYLTSLLSKKELVARSPKFAAKPIENLECQPVINKTIHSPSTRKIPEKSCSFLDWLFSILTNNTSCPIPKIKTLHGTDSISLKVTSRNPPRLDVRFTCKEIHDTYTPVLEKDDGIERFTFALPSAKMATTRLGRALDSRSSFVPTLKGT